MREPVRGNACSILSARGCRNEPRYGERCHAQQPLCRARYGDPVCISRRRTAPVTQQRDRDPTGGDRDPRSAALARGGVQIKPSNGAVTIPHSRRGQAVDCEGDRAGGRRWRWRRRGDDGAAARMRAEIVSRVVRDRTTTAACCGFPRRRPRRASARSESPTCFGPTCSGSPRTGRRMRCIRATLARLAARGGAAPLRRSRRAEVTAHGMRGLRTPPLDSGSPQRAFP